MTAYIIGSFEYVQFVNKWQALDFNAMASDFGIDAVENVVDLTCKQSGISLNSSWLEFL